MNAPLSIQEARNLYNKGNLIQNRTLITSQTIIFQLYGFHFTTNKVRSKKNKHYKIDNKNWYYYNNSFLLKCKLILQRKVYLIK